jgi:hypothetical protein
VSEAPINPKTRIPACPGTERLILEQWDKKIWGFNFEKKLFGGRLI